MSRSSNSSSGGATLKRRFAIMGFRAVGKSSISVRFVENDFALQYDPTIENTYLHNLRHNGRDYVCELVDTAGQDEFSIFQTQYAIGMHGYVLVYCVNNRHSFEIVQIIYEKILNAIGAESVPVVLVGNKSDLSGDRVVSVEEAEALAAKWNSRLIECSAKLNDNITTIFNALLDQVDKDLAPVKEEKETSTCTLQ